MTDTVHTEPHTPAAAASPAPTPPLATPPRRLASSSLLRGDAEVEIAHGAVVYRLRQTALGKLILTK